MKICSSNQTKDSRYKNMAMITESEKKSQIIITNDVDGWIEYAIGWVWSMSYQSKQAIECKGKENVTLIIMDWWIEDGIGWVWSMSYQYPPNPRKENTGWPYYVMTIKLKIKLMMLTIELTMLLPFPIATTIFASSRIYSFPNISR